MDFLNAPPIKYALTINLTIYISCIEQFWSTVKSKTINGEQQLHALVDGQKVIITESTVKRDLQLEDEKGVDYLPNSTIFEQLALTGDNVVDEAVHKELGDSLVRAAITVSSLKVEQGSDNEIASLKRRVKKLENKNRSRTDKLKRLYKVGLTVRVESSGDEENLDEDASKHGMRINDIDVDEDITLVSVQDDADKEMFDVDTLNGEEVFVAGQNENIVEEVVDATQVSTAATAVTITTEKITLAQALANLKSTKPKAKGIAFREPGESITTIFSQQLQDKGLSHNKGKGILVEPDKPLKKKDQLKLDEEIALKLQVEIDEEERIAKAEEEKINEANIAWDDIQAKVDDDYQLAKRL
ncbi:hypothetical protein Tco_1196289 [Tanacetum coccineum]